MEAALLGLFMISAAGFTTLFAHPASPASKLFDSELERRAVIGLAMGLTAVALTYSPWGQQSGAHYNPAVTLTFWRLGKIKTWDAVFYVVFQFLGGVCGVLVALLIGKDLISGPPITYVATQPGEGGVGAAFVAETFISFILMSTVLFAINHARLAKFTPLFAGTLVALFITFEAPLSGMSMNPARSFASAAPGALWSHLWIYFVAPVVGMLLAAEVRFLLPHLTGACPKLHHHNKRRCIFCGSGMAVLMVLLVTPVSAQIKNAQVGAIAITVSDLDRAVEFYTGVLDFKQDGAERQGHRDTFDRLTGVFGTNIRVDDLSLGAEHVQLVQYVTPEGRFYPRESRSHDAWFQHIAIVVSDMDSAYERLRSRKVRQISTEPQTLPEWNKNAAGIKALYFRDMDGHPLELIYFPAGKGDPRWQRASSASASKIFLGIDHTAIAVEDTETSLRFYRDLLGFRVVGESLNYGAEQEHLNHVYGSRVRITGLRSSGGGPGIEFLEYLAPRDSRPSPRDGQVNDLWHVHTTLMVDSVDAAGAEFERRQVYPRSKGEDGRPLMDATGFFVRDPDGHQLLVRSKDK